MIALPAMLFNGLELQKDFIKNGGIDALLLLIRKRDKMYQQLSCRCFALLSEN
jgi:predicted adenine nucleotide alpha hydrolase (AANH) superfamily ATPase